MPEKVTSLNGLKVTLEYGSYKACQGLDWPPESPDSWYHLN